ncbi:MAG: hypothetical protein WGN25_01030 [Candidatus Electrothrix sp. GW3-4]|uniref:hypothetical protein n=1 Tax=Candidatus Electrothrix sp. GW3-4 TaxID=3126740 RepID=UPI0030CB4EC5
MITTQILGEIHQRLHRIREISVEIEEVPNLLPDLWTMKKIDKKCQEIQTHCDWIGSHLGTGSGCSSSGSGWND